MKLEIFFDYACPYCYSGHHSLVHLFQLYPNIPLEWIPCEAHPRPESYSVHSDIAIQGMYVAKQEGGDLWKYHLAVYQALFDRHQDISNPDVLAHCAQICGLDRDRFFNQLELRPFTQTVLDNNIYAWSTCKLKAVPSFRFGNLFLGSRDGILVSKTELERFFDKISKLL